MNYFRPRILQGLVAQSYAHPSKYPQTKDPETKDPNKRPKQKTQKHSQKGFAGLRKRTTPPKALIVRRHQSTVRPKALSKTRSFNGWAQWSRRQTG
ncbi:hypothetical protein JCM33374_g3320 [Metschnikowia sp. JCM 33374]|nr:hypothetical protein JCM33374_g3320 [Metschnikowia sp. JCM 33374]